MNLKLSQTYSTVAPVEPEPKLAAASEHLANEEPVVAVRTEPSHAPEQLTINMNDESVTEPQVSTQPVQYYCD